MQIIKSIKTPMLEIHIGSMFDGHEVTRMSDRTTESPYFSIYTKINGVQKLICGLYSDEAIVTYSYTD